MNLADIDLAKSYTYDDYYKWDFEERVELIKGKVFEMWPTPNPTHQRLSSRIHVAIAVFLSGKKCEVFSAPFDVRISRKTKEDKDIITVLQPDICIICDRSKIDDKGCLGAPDIVVEILSPANNKKELKNKHEVYQEAGVLEYWVVDPKERSLQIYSLTNRQLLASRPLYAEDEFQSAVLPGLTLDLYSLFDNI